MTTANKSAAKDTAFTTRPEIVGTFGVVASTHWLASQTAMGILEKGGNAFDAAVAGGFVLQIVEPHLNGPGGEVPIMLWSEKEQRMRVICGQGPAPELATCEYFKERGMELVPGIGLLPATVPGAFGAWLTMLRDYGTMTLSEVMAPAIAYARDGFVMLPRTVQAILAVQSLFVSEWKGSADVWLPGGQVPEPGKLFQCPAIAATYTRLLEEAAAAGEGDRVRTIDAALDVFYRGFIAKEIDQFYTHEAVRDTTGQRNTGLLRYADLAKWKATYDEPYTVDFGRYTVAKCGPWSQGPVMLQQLSILKHAGLEKFAPDSSEFVHTVAEAAKLAMAALLSQPDPAGTKGQPSARDGGGQDQYLWTGDGPPQNLQSARRLAQRAHACLSDHGGSIASVYSQADCPGLAPGRLVGNTAAILAQHMEALPVLGGHPDPACPFAN